MAGPLDRSWYDGLIDDDGSGDKGTIWNRFNVDAFMDVIDLALMGTISDTDPRLTDARYPKAHNPSHGYGGTDPIDVSLLAGFPNDVTLFLRGNRTWGAGPVGPAGPPGPQGPAGATGRLWQFDYSNQTVEPPTSNQIRFDALHPYTAVTRVWVRTMTSDGVDVTAGLINVPTGSLIYVQDKNDATLHVRLTTTADPVLKTDYVEYAVVWKENGGALLNNQAVVFSPASSTTIALVVREVPVGVVNGSNTVFTLANALVAGSEQVFLNGLLQEAGGEDYVISGTTITYTVAPVTGDRLRVTYQRS